MRGRAGALAAALSLAALSGLPGHPVRPGLTATQALRAPDRHSVALAPAAALPEPSPPPRASRSLTRPPLRPRAIAARRAPGGPVPAVWRRVAHCESTDRWNADTGNGFYGGLQFTLGTWRSHGGRGRPQDASPAEQVRVGRRVLADQGVGAWPVCGPLAGLKRGD